MTGRDCWGCKFRFLRDSELPKVGMWICGDFCLVSLLLLFWDQRTGHIPTFWLLL